MGKRKPKPVTARVPRAIPASFRNDAIVCLLLIAATLAVYLQILRFDFINYDDPDYVTGNFHVRAGLNATSVLWAFSSGFASNWFPLTWLSHMADCQFFGLQSGFHHLSSLAIHILSTLILYLAFRRMTGAYWPSAFIAFIFGTHPLHVESVAWIAERKDVLCAFFWMATLWSYVRYAEIPGWRRYSLTLLTFSCGLMAKPMIVTLPFVLLLLDFWPLQRLSWRGHSSPPRRDSSRRLVEKIPFFVLSGAASVVTFLVQRHGGAVIALDEISFASRLGNALVSYVTYLVQAFVPVRLAAFYPFPDTISSLTIVAALIALSAISLIVLRYSRDHPYLGVGWLWYLGTLVPVIGLVQVGNQAHADRYTYVPMIGLSIMLAWSAHEFAQRRPKLMPAIFVSGIAVCIVCAAAGYQQTRYWKDSTSLFRHAIQLTDRNYVAWRGLGQAFKDQGHLEESARCYRKAIEARAQDPDAHNNLGEVLLRLDRTNDALAQITEALRLKPDLPEAHVNLGAAYMKLGRIDDAAEQYQAALRLQPESAAAHTGEAGILEDQGRPDDARAELLEAIRLNPDYVPAHYNLGRLFGTSGHAAEAAEQFAEAVRLQPDDPGNYFNLGIALAAQGKLDEATSEFRNAIRIDPAYAAAHFNLGTALAQSGRMDEAIHQFSEALRLQPDFTEAREGLENARAIRSRGAAN